MNDTTDTNIPNAKVFLVGGAVRDLLMGWEAKDHDYVVVGSTPEQMIDLGFVQVGADFPVFLHPVTKDEYALARTERKSGKGYTGFVVDASPRVTIEDDLSRRDFTMNAIARDLDTGAYVDPYNGRADIRNGVIRHVSAAFAEDPLRVLRAARFATRYSHFTIDEQTINLMRAMVKVGEIDHLTPERVWKELVSALALRKPSIFLQVLRQCNALKVVLPEVDALYGVPQHPQWHPEIDTGIHTEMVIDMAARLAPGNTQVAFAALTHDLGKALTPPDEWPAHRGHEKGGLEPLTALCERLKVPTAYRRLAEVVCAEHLHVHRIDEMQAKTLHDMIARVRRATPNCVENLAICCEADKRGRTGLEEDPYPQRKALLDADAAMSSVRFADLEPKERDGKRINEDLRRMRIAAIKRVRNADAQAPRNQHV